MKRLTFGLALVAFIAILTGITYAQGPGMMGGYGGYGPGGYGMGPGMMGGYGGYGPGGYGMGPGMMGGYGAGYPPGQVAPNEACQKFLKDTTGLRKELHNKRFEYFEAMRDPSTSPETVGQLSKEIYNLQAKIQAKNPQSCWWNN